MSDRDTSTRLGPHRIRVVFRGLESEGFDGKTIADDRKIILDRGLRGTKLAEIFVHECTHMISRLHGLDLAESQVRTLGLGLAQMLEPWLRLGKLDRSA